MAPQICSYDADAAMGNMRVSEQVCSNETLFINAGSGAGAVVCAPPPPRRVEAREGSSRQIEEKAEKLSTRPRRAGKARKQCDSFLAFARGFYEYQDGS